MKSFLLSLIQAAFPLRLLCLGCLCLGLGTIQEANVIPGKPVDLLKTGEFPSGWSYHSAVESSRIDDTWKVIKSEDNKADDVLVCLGKPFGYIRTKDTFQDFDLHLEWKYPKDANGNSGVLVHTMDDDKIWPKSIQVQLHQPTVGSIFPSGGAKTANMLTVKDQKLPVNIWHKLRVLSQQGRLVVFVNEKKVGEVTGCEPREGNISLQSEGSEVHFRRFRLIKLAETPDKPAEDKQPPKALDDDKKPDDKKPDDSETPIKK